MHAHRSRRSHPSIRLRARRLLTLVAATLAALLAVPVAVQAATPTIVSPGTGAQKNWLGTWAMGTPRSGTDHNGDANKVSVSVVVKHDVGRKVTGLKIDDDFDATDNATAKTAKAITLQQPMMAGGYDYSRVSYTYAPSVEEAATGMTCPLFGTRVTKGTKPIRIRAVLDDGSETATSSSNINLVAGGNCTGSDDYPYLWGQTQSATTTTPGGAVTFTFTGDAPDATGDTSDWTGINYRLRRVSDGTLSAETKVCYSSNQDGVQQTRAVTFPNRGRWVVEAELLTKSCAVTPVADDWFYLGAVDVNTAAATSPTVSLAATRPQLGGTTSVAATFADTTDNAQGGRVQDVEWDLDDDTANGTNGFEAVTLGDVTTGLTSPAAKTIDTTGKTPGLHTVRARVTDNGALSGADTLRRQVTATATYLVDTPPVATAAAVAVRAAGTVPVTLAGTDVDGDTLTATVVTAPGHGTLTGTDGVRAYTPAAGFAGTDTLTFKVEDGFGGSSTATVTIAVAPDTTISAAPPAASGHDTAEIAFGSSVSGATFACQLDAGDWEACTSPATLSALGEGPHTYRVRASAGGQTDPAPASTTWHVYLTPPVTAIDAGPSGATASDAAVFTFSTPAAGVAFTCRLDDGDWEACTSPAAFTGLADGNHTFSVRGTDPVGNVETAPPSRTFTVDTQNPAATIAEGPAAHAPSATATFSLTADEAGVTFTCRLDGGSWEPCSPAPSFTMLLDGDHALEVRATDVAGNVSPTETWSWAVDTVQPVVTIASGPAALGNATTATLTFAADEPAATTTCRLDGGTFAPCTSPLDLADLADGEHTVTVRATDAAGNVSPDATRTWTVDTAAPSVTVDDGPAAYANETTAAVAFSSPDETATFACRLDDGDWAACTSPTTVADLADGEHTIAVRATDAAGNTGAAASHTWTVDTAAPAVAIDGHPAPLTRETSATLTFSSPDEHATFTCRLDDGAREACTSPVAYAQLADGEHTVQVQATDRAGNVGSVSSATWTVDATAPVVTIDGGPQGTVAANDAVLTFAAEADSTYECAVDDGAWAACTSPLSLTALADGDHRVRVRATDPAGNHSADAERSWRVEHVTPVAALLTGPTGLQATRAATFTFDSDQPAATFQCRLDSNAPADWAACTSPKTYAAVADGTHTFQVRAVGAVSGAGDLVSRQWKVDGTAPVVAVTGGPQGTVGATAAQLTFTVDDAQATVECRLDAGAWGACSSPAAYAGLADGSHTFTARATDAAGNVGSAERTWTVDAVAAVATLTQGPAAGSVTNATSATFAFTADRSGSTFACRLDGTGSDGWASCTSPKTYTGIGEGAHTFQVRATTPAGVIGATVTRAWRVRTTAPAVAVTGGPTGSTATNTASFAFTTGEGAGSAECRLDDAAWAACVSPAQYTGLRDGVHAFEVRAQDEAGNVGTARRSWTVDTTAPSTGIASGPATGREDTTASFAFTADEPGVTFQCQVDDAPFAACAAPHAITGLVPGDHVFRVRATDAVGNVGPAARHDWTVTAPPVVDPPKVDPPKVDPPKVDPPKTDPPKVDPPKTDPAQAPTVTAKKGTSTVKATTATVVAATIACPGGSCTVVLPKSVKVKVAGRSYVVRVKGAGRITTTASVRLALPKKLRLALRGRTVRTTIKVTVTSPNGSRSSASVKVALKAKKAASKGKKRPPRG